MFCYNLLTALVILYAAKALSAEQDLFDLTEFPEPINSESLQISDSLFLAEIDESAAGSPIPEIFYPAEGSDVDDSSLKFHSSEDQSGISDSSTLNSAENIFGSFNHADLFDEGNIALANNNPPPCGGNLIKRSLDSAQSPEELADSYERDYCLPYKTQTPPPQLDLPKDLNELNDLLNPKPSIIPLLDPLLRVIPYRVLCPMIGDFTLVCCASGSETKRVKCLKCECLPKYLFTSLYSHIGYLTHGENVDDEDNPRCSQQAHVFCCFRFYVSFSPSPGLTWKEKKIQVMSILAPHLNGKCVCMCACAGF